jgi:hypothetical protein
VNLDRPTVLETQESGDIDWGSVGLTYELRDGAAEAYIQWEPLSSELNDEIEQRIRPLVVRPRAASHEHRPKRPILLAVDQQLAICPLPQSSNRERVGFGEVGVPS